MDLEISEVGWDEPDAELLRARQRQELVALYEGDSEPGPKPTGADVAVFLLGREPATGEPLACGGLRPLGAGTAELKRMFVVPHARGRGLSRLLLAGPIENYGHYVGAPDSLCFEKALGGDADATSGFRTCSRS